MLAWNDKAAVRDIAGRGPIVAYRREVRSVIRGLWIGAITKRQALTAFRRAIGQGIDKAWTAGAIECDIAEDELTQDELAARDKYIFEQGELATGFIDAIAVQSKANGGKLTPLLQRGELWINRYNDAQNQAKLMACADRKGQWQIGPTEKSCLSCSGLDRRVYRFSVWEQNDARPQSERLACKGFNCQCRIVPTDRAITRGRFPARLLR